MKGNGTSQKVATLAGQLLQAHPALQACLPALWEAYGILQGSFAGGNKLLLAGNGGSAADCQHMVGELMKSFLLPRRLPGETLAKLQKAGMGGQDALLLEGALPAIALTAHESLVSAYANDASPNLVFAQQVVGYGAPGDVFLGLSTSGNSANVVQAARAANALGLATIAITGEGGAALQAVCDVCICLPAAGSPAVQEYTLPVYHTLCAMLEAYFFAAAGG